MESLLLDAGQEAACVFQILYGFPQVSRLRARIAPRVEEGAKRETLTEFNLALSNSLARNLLSRSWSACRIVWSRRRSSWLSSATPRSGGAGADVDDDSRAMVHLRILHFLFLVTRNRVFLLLVSCGNGGCRGGRKRV